jgi:predicted molibdopterin-dependent oxidoreductase YjgC
MKGASMTGQRLNITVDGKEIEVPSGALLLHVLEDLGVKVPTLCHDERLTPYGGCRICVVARSDGRGGLVPACSTPVQRGMVIETDTPEIVESRRRQLQLLVLNHRMECPVCERRGDCRLQDLIYQYGSPEDPLPFERVKAPRDTESRVIVRDPEKCIICGKCVRICDEIQGVAAIGIVNRGLQARVATLLERPLDCEFCGQCVNACPVGALVARPYVSDVPAWQREASTTTCSYCSCGCQITVETHEGTVQRVTSAEKSRPNSGKLCAKGWLGWDVLDNPERVESPLLRRDGRLVQVSWNEALDAVANSVRETREAGRAIVGLGSSRLTTEDAYLMQRFVRSVAGSPHVNTGPVGGVGALVEGMGPVTGSPRSNATLDEMADADLVVVLRGDPARTQPLIKTELVQGVRQRGQKLILAHALSGGLERHAAMYLPLEPGTEDVLLHGVAAELLSRNPAAVDPLRELPGFSEWFSSTADYTPDLVASHTGIPAAQCLEMASMLAEARKVVAVVVTGLGIPGDEGSVTRATAWLMSLLGGEEASPAVLVLGEKANVQGVIDVGLHPGLLPGHRGAGDEQARQELEKLWGARVPPGPGWSTHESFSHAARGEVGLLHIVGQDPVGGWPQCFHAPQAIEGAAFVVLQDAFLTPTARLADVVLPVRILGDREGTLVGADGVRRVLNRVRTPPLPLPQDGQVFVELARRLGVDLPEGERVERELEQLVSWPPGKNSVRRFEAVSPPVRSPVPSGMLLDVSPQLFHSGLVTSRSRSLQELAPTVAARLGPADARELGVENGETIRVVADGRELLLRARLDRTVRAGTLVVPWRSGAGEGTAPLIDDLVTPVTVDVRRSK